MKLDRDQAERYDLDVIGGDRLARAEGQAKARGCVLVEPADDEILVDIDSEEDLRWFEHAVDKLASYINILWEVRPSPSGEPGHYHAIVARLDADYMQEAERIAFQAALGSDRMRELLSMIRLERDVEAPVLFFETPERAAEIEATRDARIRWRNTGVAEMKPVDDGDDEIRF